MALLWEGGVGLCPGLSVAREGVSELVLGQVERTGALMTRAKKRTVLVVDDEPHVRHYFKMVLEDAGFAVLTAADGEEGLALARAHRPDFVSVDLAMPRKTGRRMLVEMKRDPDLAGIPVVIVTAHARDALGSAVLRELEAAGYLRSRDDYLEKPVSAERFLEVVQQALHLGGGDGEAVEALRAALHARIADAAPDALRKALEVLSEEVEGRGG